VVEVVPQKYAIGYKNITVNDQFFNGHFPERAIMPGACTMEHSLCPAQAPAARRRNMQQRRLQRGRRLQMYDCRSSRHMLTTARRRGMQVKCVRPLASGPAKPSGNAAAPRPAPPPP
jgi:3-hydroxymyristoyl/3-hydroxydecanoyl-(acyl carrier protein) dehydratase